MESIYKDELINSLATSSDRKPREAYLCIPLDPTLFNHYATIISESEETSTLLWQMHLISEYHKTP